MTEKTDTTTVPEAQPNPEPAKPETAIEDPDDILVRQLEAEAAKPANEEAAQTPAAPATQPAADTKKAGHEPIMVPKERLDEEAGKRRKAEDDARYLRGLAEGLVSRPQQPKARQQEAQPQHTDPAQRLGAIQAEITANAEQYDAATITYAELTRRQAVLEDEKWTLRESMKQPQRAPDTVTENSLIVDERTAAMEQAHPYTLLIPANTPVGRARWDYLENEAAAQLAAEGTPLHYGKDGALPSREQLVLRDRMARLTDTYGPQWVGPLTPKASPGNPTPSPAALARNAKIDLAEQHPIDVSTLGNGAATTDIAAIEARIESGTMTEDEIAALPEGIQRQIARNAF
jgi:hypothetical protein